MSFTGSAFSFGGSPGSALRFSQTRGRIQGSAVHGVNYPSPFFDIAHTYLPTTYKQLFRFCRYYFLTNPLINAVVFKMSEYPITDIIIDHEDARVRRRWMEYFHDHLRYRMFQIECGLDHFCYGNAFISLSFPFRKYLTCQSCKWCERADRIRNFWTFTNFEFRLSCPKCGTTADATVFDHYYSDASGIRLVRWNCEDVEISYRELNGESTYFYTIPGGLRNDIVIGKKDIVETAPQIFIQALRQRKGIIFSKDNLFHLKRPSLAGQDRGWGTPQVLPVLKDTFYLQLMKKSQEAILAEHIVPLRILFPQAASGSSDPFCLSFRTLTEAGLGYKPAGEVRLGDLVKTAYGRYLPVSAVKKRAVQSNEKVFRIEAAGMAAAPVEASEEHPFLAVRSHGKQKRHISNWLPEWVEAKDLAVGDFVAYPLSREIRGDLTVDVSQYLSCFIATEPRFIPWSKYLACIVGYYLAEGYEDAGRITFSLNAKETWICDELDEAFQQLLGRKGFRYSRGANGLAYCLSDSVLAKFLRNFCGHLAWNKRFPGEVVFLPREILLELVRCLINGDGGPENSIRMNRTVGRACRTRSVTYTTTSFDLALKLRELLLYLGIVGKVHTTKIHRRMRHDVHRVKINGDMAVALWNLLGWKIQTEKTIRDTSHCFIRGGYAFFRVQKKEVLDDVDYVYGFQVDGDKSFCVPACATHNTHINLVDWRDQVAAEIARWRHDVNYIPILPLPVGQQSIGGDGKALLLFNEMQQQSELIVAGMGVPREFVFGGLSFAGTSVSMRMLENAFISYVGKHRLMSRWVMKMVAYGMNWPEANIRFKPFKMADDLQRKAYLFQLNQAGKISDTSLLADADLEQEQEDEIMVREVDKRLEATKKQQLAMAEIQGEAQLIMQKYQVKAQQAAAEATAMPAAPGEPGGPEGPNAANAGGIPGAVESPLNAQQALAPGQVPPGQLPPGQGQGQGSQGQQTVGADLVQLAQGYAGQMAQLPPEQQQVALQALAGQSPELAQLVQQFLGVMNQGQPQAQQEMAAPTVDARPLPDKLPPRRLMPPV